MGVWWWAPRSKVTKESGEAGADDDGLAGPVGLEAFREKLEAMVPGWRVKEGRIVGPDGGEVRLARRHLRDVPVHVDVLFVLDAKAGPIGLWDCVVGPGSTQARQAQAAAHIWSQTTGSALLELMYSEGRFANRVDGDKPGGFRGWHAVHGHILGYGHGDSSYMLQKWLMDYPLLPALQEALGPDVARSPGPHGVKVLFGGDGIGEIALDGETHPEATRVLLALPWPRLDPPAVVRTYFILVHPTTRQF